MNRLTHFLLLWLLAWSIVVTAQSKWNRESDVTDKDVLVGAARTNLYFDLLNNKRIAVVANQTSVFNGVHLVDTLLASGMKLKMIFAPEHGFRGHAEAGEKIMNGKDHKTGLPVVSLYGEKKKPSATDFKQIDVVVFDIQDVGARFYTYISTLHYIMEACAEQNKPLIVLDRPNPNGFYVDGPLLQNDFKSFVGMHPVPIVHGMTIGEYAQMINGEKWLKDSIQCNLKVITVYNYTHAQRYQLPIAPSPNLSTMEAVYLYPSLCLFEGTVVSVGRGTDKPFCQIGHPLVSNGTVSFVPRSLPGFSNKPMYEGDTCRGFELSEFSRVFLKNSGELYLYFLSGMYDNLKSQTTFFNSFFDKLAGSATLRQQIQIGINVELIKQSWQSDLEKFKKIREKYLLYPDFNK